MEEWEDELQSRLINTIEEFLAKGITVRQVIGVLETAKMELMPQIMMFEEEDER